MSDDLRIPGFDREPRSCDSCHACCIAPQIDHLAKPAQVRCWHLDSYRGCGIYPDRGEVCRKYQCLWLRGALGVGNRPDKLGLVLALFQLSDGTPCISATELWPGAFNDPLATWALGQLQPVTGLILRSAHGGQTAWSGDKEKVDHAVELTRPAVVASAPEPVEAAP